MTELTISSDVLPNEEKEANGDLVEGGIITDLEEPEVTFHEAKHRANTTRLLAVSLVGFLAFLILVHYACTMVLEFYDKREAVESLSKIFNNWLPVITGLVGSAVTYYFTKEK
jgi:hypothetical protein